MNLRFLKSFNDKFALKVFKTFVILIFLISFSFIAFFIHREGKYLTDTLIKDGRLLARVLASSSRIGVFSENEDMLKDPVESIFQQEEVLEVSIFNIDGRLLKERERPGIIPLEKSIKEGGIFEKLKESEFPLYLEGKDRLEFWSPVLSRSDIPMMDVPFLEDAQVQRKANIIGFVRITVDRKGLNRQLNDLLFKGIGIGIIFIIISSGITYFVTRKTVKPLNRLTEVVNTFGAGGIVDKVPVETNDEIGNLARAFNRMVESLTTREQALRESEEKYRGLFEGSRDAIYITSTDLKLIDVNQSFLDLFGYTKEELEGMRFKDIYLNPDDRGRFKREIDQKGYVKDHPMKLVKKDGTGIDCLVTTTIRKMDDGDILAYQGIIRDITEMKKTEGALRKSEHELRIITQNVPALLSYIDADGYYRFVNKRYEEWFGVKEKEVIGRNYREFLGRTTYELIKPHVDKALSGHRVTYEESIPYRDRKARWVRVDYVPDMDQQGKTVGFFVLSTDITDLKQAQDSLIQANKQLLGEHNQRKILSRRLIDLLEKERSRIGMELHDHIGQTITSIKMNLEMIYNQIESTGSGLESQLKAAKEKTIQAIKDLRRVSYGLTPGTLDTLGLVPSLHELLNQVEKETNMKIHFFRRNLPAQFGYEKDLAIYRIVQEALNNIVKYARAETVFINLIKKDGMLLLSIEDDGVGFDAEKVMGTSGGKGTLGLLIMRERTVQLDGEFSIESEIGKGTHLVVEIPV